MTTVPLFKVFTPPNIGSTIQKVWDDGMVTDWLFWDERLEYRYHGPEWYARLLCSYPLVKDGEARPSGVRLYAMGCLGRWLARFVGARLEFREARHEASVPEPQSRTEE